MNTSRALAESSRDSRDLGALSAVPAEKLEEPWFEEQPVATRSSVPPASGVFRVGEFLGDPLADSWLR
jgi:hypothetical protein